MGNNVGGVISGEVRDALLRNLSESKKLYQAWVSYPKHLVKPASGENPLATLFLDAEGRPQANLTAANSWPHSLNNLQQCLEYLDRLKEQTEATFDDYFPPDGP